MTTRLLPSGNTALVVTSDLALHRYQCSTSKVASLVTTSAVLPSVTVTVIALHWVVTISAVLPVGTTGAVLPVVTTGNYQSSANTFVAPTKRRVDDLSSPKVGRVSSRRPARDEVAGAYPGRGYLGAAHAPRRGVCRRCCCCRRRSVGDCFLVAEDHGGSPGRIVTPSVAFGRQINNP